MVGHGTEGAAYVLEGGTRVLKVNVTSKGQSIEHLARRVKGRTWAVSVLACGPLIREGQGRGRGGGAPAARGFWYVMARLYPLYSRERRILDCGGFALVAGAKGQMTKTASEAKWRQAVALLSPALQRTLSKARRAGYHDLHGGNVMKTSSGAYKVIDVESLRPVKRR
jgi:hypothetical protein